MTQPVVHPEHTISAPALFSKIRFDVAYSIFASVYATQRAAARPAQKIRRTIPSNLRNNGYRSLPDAA